MPHFYYYVGHYGDPMKKRDVPGQFEQLVLTAVLTLGEDAYGISIHHEVKQLAQPRAVSLGAVYVTLDRMEDKGFVRSWLSDPKPERGGRSKRQYRLEPSGEKALRESVELGRRILDVLSKTTLRPRTSWGESQ
jgi:DNA-binding PadR family transcriptional regulator